MNQAVKISVTDTMGVCSTREDHDAIAQLIGEQIFEETSPGPHAILIVCRIDRFTSLDEEIIELIRSMFGSNAVRYCIFIFTHEDQLEPGDTIQKCVKKSNRVHSLMHQYQNRYLSINNKNVTEEKIKELIEMINKMVTENNDEYYTNAEYQRIELLRQFEKKQRVFEEEAKQSEMERLRQEKKNLEQELANERLRQKNTQHEDVLKQQSHLEEELYAGAKNALSSLLDIVVHAAKKCVDDHFKEKKPARTSAPVLSASRSQLIPSPAVKDHLKISSSVPTASDSTSEQIQITSVRTATSSVAKNSIPQYSDHKTQYTPQSP
ncbi:unnamed protein product, partial [Didymodactylos carnosus]